VGPDVKFDGTALNPATRTEDGQPQSNRGSDLDALKDSVAAHQAMCGCHPVLVGNLGFVSAITDNPKWSDLDKPVCCERTDHGPMDSSGTMWHLDPLCKVRPEAKENA
jgi:hypothetical protein